MARSSLLTAPIKRGSFLRILKQHDDIFDTAAGHDHDGTDSKAIVASVTYGAAGDMAAAGTGTANAAGAAAKSSRSDHVHKIGDHDHSDNTKGNTIALAALGAGFFSADANGRAKFAAGLFNVATFQSVVSGAILSADVTGQAFMAAGFLSADATGRAFMATGYFNAATLQAKVAAGAFDATTCEAVFADNAIPADKVNWSFALPTTITPDDAAAIGAATGPANASHVHAITCAAPSAGLAAADAEGAATSFARSNHVHKATVTDAVSFTFGASDDAGLRWSTADADNHAFVLFLGASKALHVTDDVTVDWNVGADSHPSLYVHSNTTPATDYLKISHDATTATIQAVGGTLDLTAVGSVTVNEASADVDFRVESNGLQYAIYVDGAKDALVLGANADASSADQVVRIARAARTATAATRFADLWVQPAAAVTTAGGATTHPVIASVYLTEPNITLVGGDTITVAATLYIADEPTEGAANYGLAMATSLGILADAKDLAIGASADCLLRWSTADADNHALALGLGASLAFHVCQAADIATDWNVAAAVNPTLYIHGATTPATEYVAISTDETDAHLNAVGANWSFEIGGTAELTLAANALNLVNSVLYGSAVANGDLTLTATSHGTVATSYIVASQMIDATVNSLAVRVKAGAIGDGETGQTDLNGEVGIDSTGQRWYFRYGAAWHYCAITAGFQIPSEEQLCPICGKEIEVGNVVAGVIDKILEDGARHGLYVHDMCRTGKYAEVTLPKAGLHKAAKVSKTTFPSAQERKERGLVKVGDKVMALPS